MRETIYAAQNVRLLFSRPASSNDVDRDLVREGPLRHEEEREGGQDEAEVAEGRVRHAVEENDRGEVEGGGERRRGRRALPKEERGAERELEDRVSREEDRRRHDARDPRGHESDPAQGICERVRARVKKDETEAETQQHFGGEGVETRIIFHKKA